MEMINKNLKVRIYPTKVDFNDNREKIVSINKIEQNFGNRRFVWNKNLEFIINFKQLLIQYGYNSYVKINNSSLNILLNMLKEYYPFLKLSESSSLQQTNRDLNIGFKRYHNPELKSNHPKLKTKNNNKQSFRIQNNNNIRIEKDKNNFDKLKLAKLGLVKFKTSKEYKILLKKGSDKNDKTVKIKHATIKKEHNKYYAVINIECIYTPIKKTGHQQIGIDIGCDKLAVLSNKQEIANLDLKKEMQKIIHYQKIMSKHKKHSNRYREAKRLHNKWWEKFINKRENYYNKKSTNIVRNSIFIAVQNENIISWKHNKKIGKKIQINAPRSFMEKLEYKSKWNQIPFEKIPKKFPSTQKCSARC